MIKSGRLELLQEFYVETKQLLLICTTDLFLKSYNKYCSGRTPDNVIEEIQDIREKEKSEVANEKFERIKKIRRNIETEFLYKLKSMKAFLLEMLINYDKIDRIIERVEYIAKSIIEDTRYRRYHSKILMIIDELEQNVVNNLVIFKCIEILDEIIEQF